MTLDKVGRALAKAPSQLLVGLGLAILAGTLCLAALLPSKELAVAVAVVGTFCGTALLGLFLPRVIYLSKAQELEDRASRSELRGRLKQTQTTLAAAEQQLVDLAREVARLESMRIDLAAFRPILQLGLLEVETTVTDFQHRPLGEAREEAWWRNGYRQAYVGVVQIPVKAHLGVDLRRVRIHETTEGRLLIGGLAMSAVTDTGEGARWLLDEIRTEYLKDNRVVKFKGDHEDARVKALNREQEGQIRARLQLGQDFKVFEAGLIRSAEQLLRVLLAPLGKELVFQTQHPPEAPELFAFLAAHNRRVELALARLNPDLSLTTPAQIRAPTDPSTQHKGN